MNRLALRTAVVLCALSGVVVGLPACDSKDAKASDKPLQVTEGHRDALRRGDRRRIGQPCDLTGKHDCETGVCLHVQATSRLGGRVCSRACRDATGCPSKWACVQTWPGPGSDFCVPPSNWRAERLDEEGRR